MLISSWSGDDLLGLIYVCAWSISMYPPVLNNWKQGSTIAISVDFVLLNTTGYFYLILSLLLQLYRWIPANGLIENDDKTRMPIRPKVSQFDFCYCLHGFIMNWVLVTQVLFGIKLWKFKADHHQKRMKTAYYRFLMISLTVFTMLTLKFGYENAIEGWENARTLSYCNNLFLLKISMSLVKYLPQVIHNYDRKSMKGFAIQSVILDITGGVASMLQLIWQLCEDEAFDYLAFIANFGKIGLAIVTLTFNFIFISQWLLYRS